MAPRAAARRRLPAALAAPAAAAAALLLLRRRRVAAAAEYVCHAGAAACEEFASDGTDAWLATAAGLENAALEEERPRTLGRLFRSSLEANRTASILTIGANDLTMDREQFQSYVAWSPRMVFVEPNPEVLPALHLQLSSLGINVSGCVILNAAVCERDEENASFFRVSSLHDNHRTFPPGIMHPSEISSLSRQHIEKDARYAGWLEEVHVRCLTPTSLLKEVGLEAASVDVLHVDAEGADFFIMNELLSLEGFRPALMMFEWVNSAATVPVMKILSRLTRMGYSVYQVGMDLVALANASTTATE